MGCRAERRCVCPPVGVGRTWQKVSEPNLERQAGVTGNRRWEKEEKAGQALNTGECRPLLVSGSLCPSTSDSLASVLPACFSALTPFWARVRCLVLPLAKHGVWFVPDPLRGLTCPHSASLTPKLGLSGDPTPSCFHPAWLSGFSNFPFFHSLNPVCMFVVCSS